MKWPWIIGLLLLAVLLAVVSHMALRGETEGKPIPQPAMPRYVPGYVAANGVVEGARPEVPLRPEIAGTLAVVCVRENQDVSRGCLLAELSNETQKQQVSLAQAEVAVAKAELEKLRNGERTEKRKAAEARESAQRVIYERAKADCDRVKKLTGTLSAASREEFDNQHFKMLLAKSELDQAIAERALVEAPARPDEEAAAIGRVAAAEARLRLAQAELAKTRLLAPVQGQILRIYMEPGEQAGPLTGQPLLLMADLSKRRVRAFIEELDALRVQAGQTAVVTVDGLPGREFAGHVAEGLPRMGKRSPRTDAPEEYKDLYFREVLIDLAAAEELVLNLRVKVRIKAGR